MTASDEHSVPPRIPAPDEPSIPELEEDETIAPRPEEEAADLDRATPDLAPHPEG
ncbi:MULTISPECIES: hypothetical protein [Rathayibacter]|jgi:hypothetical protein|uniref:hypothetical protein n=1 Tax=Rathayibacter TaxID=33886 RepID=UPI0010EF818A|nr:MULTISPECIES: hypothetical protein [Rathayibacter]NRG41720.1 hypothetical protein [Rathayibacter sp. VKM Ac-2835]QHF25121.1 hypothetical protein GTU73_14685 [Rathayibacter sp. VKM Ac-2804]TDX76575.1 hypothetical protein EDF35_3264 [Rathayibacter sp. PhB151]